MKRKIPKIHLINLMSEIDSLLKQHIEKTENQATISVVRKSFLTISDCISHSQHLTANHVFFLNLDLVLCFLGKVWWVMYNLNFKSIVCGSRLVTGTVFPSYFCDYNMGRFSKFTFIGKLLIRIYY